MSSSPSPDSPVAGHRRRQRGRGQCRLPAQRGVRDLPDHAILDDGRTRRSVVRRASPQHLGRRADRDRDAERGRRGRRGARLAAGWGPHDDLHGVARAAADDPEHVQDRRRTDARGLPCRGTGARLACAVDLRRPPGRDGRARHRLRATGLGLGAGSPRPGRDRADGHARVARAVRALLRRLPHLARDHAHPDAVRRRPAGTDRSIARHGASRRVAEPGPSVHPRHGAEPRRLLPDARGRQSPSTRACRPWSRPRWRASPRARDGSTASWSTRARPMPSA